MAADTDVKRPESVLVVIYTPRRECLLLERVVPAGFWQSVTGTLDWDETPAECAAREVREETGLDPTGLRDARIRTTFPIMPEWRARFAPGVETNLEHLWYLEITRATAIRLNPLEHRAYEWVDLRDATARVASWTNREALERLAAERFGQ
jgi:dihydroneopterin triphosphate diphosphatase